LGNKEEEKEKKEDVKTVIRRWETNVKPRKIGCHGKIGLVIIIFTEISAKTIYFPLDSCDVTFVHEFGFINPKRKMVHTGWLADDTLVEIKLFERAVHIWKRKHEGKDLFVKVTPVDVALANQQSFSMDLDESVDISETRARNKSWPLVNVAVSKHMFIKTNIKETPFLMDLFSSA
jgi:hypothetical protein